MSQKGSGSRAAAQVHDNVRRDFLRFDAVWLTNTLYRQVSSDVARLLGTEKPILMVTDPPYGVSYDPEWRDEVGKGARAIGHIANDDRSDWSEAWALFPGAVAYVWHAGVFAAEVADSLAKCDFKIRAQIIWSKPHFAISRGAYHWQHEPCWYAVKKGENASWRGDHKQTTLWQVATTIGFHSAAEPADADRTGHPTQKPVELMRRPIQNHTATGQAIYEPFCGSGSTVIAAEQTGRRCLAMELDPKYVDLTLARWEAFTGKQATLDG
jgi:DNA modification methylase